jgi:hypothetical protein
VEAVAQVAVLQAVVQVAVAREAVQVAAVVQVAEDNMHTIKRKLNSNKQLIQKT